MSPVSPHPRIRGNIQHPEGIKSRYCKLIYIGAISMPTTELQHLMMPHCIMILLVTTVYLKGRAILMSVTHTFNIPDADDVLPSRRYHGLNPSEVFFVMMR